MSDSIVKIIPGDPFYRMDTHEAQQVVNLLKARFPMCSVEATFYETPAFVDCGGNLVNISCPVCGASLSFDWWGDAMDASFQSRFSDLSVNLPCCGKMSTLNDLDYHFPCGFSCVEFDIWNPPEFSVDEELSAKLQTLLGGRFRTIYAHI